jgi:hypothetical protein
MKFLEKFFNYGRKHGFVDTFRKLVYRLFHFLGTISLFFRRCRFYFRTKSWIKGIGPGIVIKGIGNDTRFEYLTYLYEKVVIEISEKAHLRVGNHFTLSYGGLNDW